MGHKTSLNRCKTTEIITNILSDNHELRLVLNTNKNIGKPTYTWKLNNALLNDNLGQGRNKKRNKIPMEGVPEIKFGAETEE